MEPLESRELLAITVNTNLDFTDGDIEDGSVSLRDAVEVASAGETINFAASLSGATITLDRDNLGEIAFNKSLTIDASALDSLTIDADDPTFGFHNNGDGIRIFNITDSSNGVNPPVVELIGLTLTGADPAGNPEGGAIRSEAILVIRDTIITENGANVGAGIFLEVEGTGTSARDVLTIENSHIVGNSAVGDGGGVFALVYGVDNGTGPPIFDAAEFIVQDSTISGGNIMSSKRRLFDTQAYFLAV